MVMVQNEDEYRFTLTNFTMNEIWNTLGNFFLEKEKILRRKTKQSNEKSFCYLAKINPSNLIIIANDLFNNRDDLKNNLVSTNTENEFIGFDFGGVKIKICTDKDVPIDAILWDMHWDR